MQPNPFFPPGFLATEWQFGQPAHLPYTHPPWHRPGNGRPLQPSSQLWGYAVRPQAALVGRRLLESIQEVFPRVPAAVAVAMEMHVAMSVKHEDLGMVELMPLAHLFAEAGRGWGLRLEVLAPSKVAMLPLAAACTDSLKQFQEVYLSGQEVPSLYITYYRGTGRPHDQHVSVLARPLEAALQETLSHPALCLPNVGGLAGGLGSHLSHMAPPSGKAMLLDAEVEHWMDAEGLQKLHAASHKDIHSLLQDLPGILTSSNVSFGLKQLVPKSVLSQPSYEQPSPYCGSIQHSGQHVSQAPQPFSQILGTVQETQGSSDTKKQKPFCFRQFMVHNNTPNDVRLVDVRFSSKLPLWPNTLGLTDDSGISAFIQDTDVENMFRSSAVSDNTVKNRPEQQQRQRSRKKQLSRRQHQVQAQEQAQQQQQAQQHSVQSDEPERESQNQAQQESQQLQQKPEAVEGSVSLQSSEAEGKQQDGLQCVLLRAGEEYTVTVVLNCVDGPHRKSECGVLPQLVLFTLMVPHSKAMPHGLLQQHAASRGYASYGFEGTWPEQHMPGAVKPTETISLKDGSLADIAVVGQILYTPPRYPPAVAACNIRLQSGHICMSPDRLEHKPLDLALQIQYSELNDISRCVRQ